MAGDCHTLIARERGCCRLRCAAARNPQGTQRDHWAFDGVRKLGAQHRCLPAKRPLRLVCLIALPRYFPFPLFRLSCVACDRIVLTLQRTHCPLVGPLQSNTLLETRIALLPRVLFSTTPPPIPSYCTIIPPSSRVHLSVHAGPTYEQRLPASIFCTPGEFCFPICPHDLCHQLLQQVEGQRPPPCLCRRTHRPLHHIVGHLAARQPGIE